MKLVLCLICVLFSTNATAGVFDWFFTEKPPDIVRAKGTVANIALPLSHRITSKKFTWIPPSTALLLDNQFDSASGKQLALSAHGIWLYVSKEGYVPNLKQAELHRTLITTKKIIELNWSILKSLLRLSSTIRIQKICEEIHERKNYSSCAMMNMTVSRNFWERISPKTTVLS